MAKNDIFVRIGLKGLSGFKQDFKDATHAMRRAGQNMKRNGEELSKMVTLPLVGVGAAAVASAANFEKLQVSMNSLTGSAQEGAKAFRRLKELSAGTPFQLQDLIKAQNTLMGFGLSSDDAFDSVKRLGDIVAITGADMGNLAIAFGQSAAEGRVMSKDIRQFINNGVPMIKLLAEEMGVAKSSIFDLASEGKITFDVLQRAFKRSTDAGGMFADGMKKQSRTIAGLFSTLKDNVSILLAEIGQAIVDAGLREFIIRVTDEARKMVKVFADLSPKTKKLAVIILGLVAAVGPLLVVLGQMKLAIAALRFSILGLGTVMSTLASVGIAALVAGFASIAYGLTELNDKVDINEAKTKALNKAKKQAISVASEEINKLKSLTEIATDENKSKQARLNALKELQRISPKYNGVLKDERINTEKLKAVTEGLTDALIKQSMVKAAQSQFEKLSEQLLKLQSGVEQVGISFSEKLAIGFKAGLKSILGFGKGYEMVTEGAKEAANNQKNAIKGVQAQMEALKGFIDKNKGMFNGLFNKPQNNGGGGDMGDIGDIGGGAEEIDAGIKRGGLGVLDKLANGKINIFETVPKDLKMPNIFGLDFAEDSLDTIRKKILALRQPAEETFASIMNKIQKGLDLFLDYIDEYMPAIQGLFNFWGQALDNKDAKQQKQYEKELERIQNSTMSEKAKEEAITKLNEKRDKQERKLAREKAKRDKAVALFNAIVNGAAAVVKVAANPILAAIVAGIAAANIAAIAAEPLPALAEGGIAYGPTTALVGDNVNARVNPEVIAPLDKLKGMMNEGGNIRLSGNFRIDGQDLIYVIEENQQIRERR